MDFSAIITYNLLPWQWVAWISMGITIGLSKTGFSSASAVTIPVIAVIFGAMESTGLTLPLFCFADIIAVVYYHRHAEWKYILRLIPWTLAGFGVALFVVHLVPIQAFKYLMGTSILAGIIVMVWNERFGQDKPPPSGLWFSAIFGTAGGFAAMMGPAAGSIIAVFFLSMRIPKNSFVGTIAWFFFIANFLRLPLLIFIWKTITVKTLLFNLTLIPLIIAGSVLGILLVKKISEPIYRKVVIILTLMSTVLLFF